MLKIIKFNKIVSKISLVITFTILQLSIMAQPRTTRWEVKTPGLFCEECEAIIESRMLRVDGVMEIDAKWRAKKVVIRYIPDRVDTANLKVFIAQLGFDAGDEKAEPSQKKLLPECCQKDPKAKPVATVPTPTPVNNAPIKPVNPVTVPAKPTAPTVGKGVTPVAKPVNKPTTPATKPATGTTTTKPTIAPVKTKGKGK